MPVSASSSRSSSRSSWVAPACRRPGDDRRDRDRRPDRRGPRERAEPTRCADLLPVPGPGRRAHPRRAARHDAQAARAGGQRLVDPARVAGRPPRPLTRRAATSSKQPSREPDMAELSGKVAIVTGGHAGHRPCGGRGPRSRRGVRDGVRHEPRARRDGDRRDARRRARRSTGPLPTSRRPPTWSARRPDSGALRRRRHPGQQRGHPALRDRRRHRRGAVGPRPGCERQGHVPGGQARDPRDAPPRWRLDRQRVVRPGVHRPEGLRSPT